MAAGAHEIRTTVFERPMLEPDGIYDHGRHARTDQQAVDVRVDLVLLEAGLDPVHNCLVGQLGQRREVIWSEVLRTRSELLNIHLAR